MSNPQLSPILQVAEKILKNAGRKGMHIKSIAEAAVSINENMGLTVDEFQKKVGASLAANLKLKTQKSTFAIVKWDNGPRKGKPKQGWYRIKEKRVAHPPCIAPTPPSTIFLGKAGEYAVMSELLFWGFNVSQMTVDDGIDLVANKNNKFFFIQVKTSTQQSKGTYSFNISKKSFLKYHGQNVYYVFVLRFENSNKYIILPGTILDSFVRTKIIQDSATLSVRISVNDKHTEYKLNAKADIGHYLGNFGATII